VVRLQGSGGARLGFSQKGDLLCLLWGGSSRFKAANSRTGQPEEPDMTPPILESVSVWFVDRHVVAIMGHEMPPRDPNDDDDEDEKDEEDEEQDDEPAVIREPEEDE
jgi:hypothetical protein